MATQPVDENIRVLVRVRPLTSIDDHGVPLSAASAAPVLETTPLTVTTHGRTVEQFTFDVVADARVTQEEIFRTVGKDITDSCLQGYNATIICYGQTGAGKTYTMHGPSIDAEDLHINEQRGLLPRTLEYLFAQIAREQRRNDRLQYKCRCSYVEIYNEVIYDLLDVAGNVCLIREDNRRVYLENATEVPLTSTAGAYERLRQGTRNRHVAATSMNHESSRSHTVFTLYIESTTVDGELRHTKEARFNLVDLAGSERQRDTNATGQRLREANQINKSLLTLGNVINALVDVAAGRPRHIHYRDSKLTFLLRDSLGGNSKTFLIANISPAPSALPETVSTIKFANRANQIRNQVVVNDITNGNGDAMRERIRVLEGLLAQRGVAVPAATTSASASAPLEARVSETDALVALLLQQVQAAEAAAAHERNAHTDLNRLVDRLQSSIQKHKMILRLRDATISDFKRNRPLAEIVSSDPDRQGEEIEVLRRMIEKNPDVIRFAMENQKLRAQLVQAAVPAPSDPTLLRQLQEHVATLTAKLRAATEEKGETVPAAEVVALQAQLDDLRGQLAYEAKRTAALAAAVTEAKMREAEAERASAEALAAMESTRQQIDALEMDTQAMLSAKDAELAKAFAAVEALRNEHSRSSTDVSAKTIELVSTQTENTRLRQALDEKSLEVAKLRSTVDKLKSDARRVSDFASQSRTVNQDLVRGLHEQVAIVTADRDSLQSQLEEARAKGRAAHTRAEAMTERVQLLEGELERLQRYTDAEVARLETALRTATETVEALTAQVQTLQDDADGLQEEVTMRSRRAVLDEKALRTLEAELTASEEAHRVTAARAERLQESVRILSQESGSQVSETMREVLTARSALEAAQAENERLATEMASGATYTAELQATVDSLQHDLAMESESLREMRARLASAAVHETDLTEQLERAVRERDDVLVHMGHLEADVTARCKADLDRQLAAASQELVKAQRDFEQLASEFEQAKVNFMKHNTDALLQQVRADDEAIIAALHKDYKAKLAGLEDQLATAQRAAERAAAADEVVERAQRIASLEAQLEMAAIERRKAESEAQQAQFRLSNAENDIDHWAAACKRASDAEEQEHARAEALDSKLKELQERFRQTDEARAALEAERERGRDDTENGAGSVRQRMQYQVQLKRENNALRDEIAQLRLRLNEPATAASTSTLPGSPLRPQRPMNV